MDLNLNPNARAIDCPAVFRQLRAFQRLSTAACLLILTWLSRARDRRQLAALCDRSLKDMGISRADAYAEYRKFFWQP
jgi:uncharacterized protein YjiS (DUF1127 family)